MSVTAIITMKAKSGQRDALCQALAPSLEVTRRAENCEGVDLFVDKNDPDRVALIERWTSVKAHVTHLEQLANSGAIEGVVGLLSEMPRPRHYAET